jgi:hypothetical protein
MVVGVDTAAAGILDGMVTLNFVSDGASTSGLGITPLDPQQLQVTANISVTAYNLADPVINNSQPIAFGNFREGDVVTAQALSITNAAPDDGFSEKLNAAANGTTGGVIANGAFNLLDPQATNNTDITVSIDTGTAGSKNGDATIDFVSDGTGTSGLGQTALPSQDVQVTGAVYRLAQGQAAPDPISFGNLRLNDVASQALTVSNIAANDGFSESLGVGVGSSGDTSISGSVAGLIAAGGSDSNLNVALDTSVAGNRSGTVDLSYSSDGTGTSGFAAISAGTQSIDVSGAVYRLAEGQAAPDPINFGNVHLNDVASQALTVSNIAANDGFSESLGVGVGSSGDASVSGAVTGLIAAGSNDSNLSVALDTSLAGNRSGTVDLIYSSDGTGTSGLAAIAAGSQSIAVTGGVYRLAEATIDNTPDFLFGNVHVGDTVQQAISISNTAVADVFSEDLNASFGTASDGRITTNSGSINQLVAGDTDSSSMVVGVDTAAAGVLNGSIDIDFASEGTNNSGLGITALASQQLPVTANITVTAYNLADPVINNTQPLAFGNYREGDGVIAQALSITNNAPVGFSEALNADANGTTGGVIATGFFDLLGPRTAWRPSILNRTVPGAADLGSPRSPLRMFRSPAASTAWPRVRRRPLRSASAICG